MKPFLTGFAIQRTLNLRTAGSGTVFAAQDEQASYTSPCLYGANTRGSRETWFPAPLDGIPYLKSTIRLRVCFSHSFSPKMITYPGMRTFSDFVMPKTVPVKWDGIFLDSSLATIFTSTFLTAFSSLCGVAALKSVVRAAAMKIKAAALKMNAAAMTAVAAVMIFKAAAMTFITAVMSFKAAVIIFITAATAVIAAVMSLNAAALTFNAAALTGF
jgi:hypothetical protein